MIASPGAGPAPEPGGPPEGRGGAALLMPVGAYRVTWFADALDEYCGAGRFRRLLRALAPATYERLQDRTPRVCLARLAEHIDQHLFPLHPYFMDEALEPGETEVEYFLDGIPYDALGMDWWNDTITSPAVALCAEMSPNGPDDACAVRALDPYRDALTHWIREVRTVAPFRGKGLEPPRGREWIEPWDAANWLYLWVHGQTGYAWLDVSPGWSDEDPTMMPPWTLGSIQWLTRSWAVAEVLWDDIEQLICFVDEAPAERLPLLAGAIRGDRETLRMITREGKSEKAKAGRKRKAKARRAAGGSV